MIIYQPILLSPNCQITLITAVSLCQTKYEETIYSEYLLSRKSIDDSEKKEEEKQTVDELDSFAFTSGFKNQKARNYQWNRTAKYNPRNKRCTATKKNPDDNIDEQSEEVFDTI